MEALAGVALAGNILQFLQLGLKILSKGNAYKRSHDGAFKEHIDIQFVVDDLDKSLSQLGSDTSDGLQELVDRCKETGKELKSMMQKVAAKRRKGGLFSSYRAALCALWHEKDIEELEKRFEALRQELALHIQILMRGDVTTLLKSSLRGECVAGETHSQLEVLAERHEDTSGRLQQCITSSRDAILARCSSPCSIPSDLIPELGELRKLCGQLLSSLPMIDVSAHASSNASINKDDFLQTFKFREMNDREESIPKAHRNTYEWILNDSKSHLDDADAASIRCCSEREKLKKELEATLASMGISVTKNADILAFQDVGNFSTAPLQEWLKAGEGIFWIWGKPGCGKSTMMKAFLQNPRMQKRLKELLLRWGGKQVLIGSFFFFRPGMDLQKSKQGFLQALLHQILSQRPKMIDILFSPLEQSQAVARSRKQAGSERPVWSINELRRALREWREHDESCLYLHVDGIDEIDCQPLDLANLLKELSNYTNVKILAAGRYHAAFDFCFSADQKLNIHELTEPDILRFVMDRLNQPKLWALLSPAKRSTQFVKIMREIISAAQGVFQWVKIVVESLMQGVYSYETFDRLFARLQEYPKDLDDLYRFLYANLDPRYTADVAFWLLTIFHKTDLASKDESHKFKYVGDNGEFSMNTFHMFQAEQYEAWDSHWLVRSMQSKRKGISNEARAMHHRMRAQCPHFFDFSVRQKYRKHVTFSHRTVLDFLCRDENSMIHELSLHLDTRKNPELSYIVVRFLEECRLCLQPSWGNFTSWCNFMETILSAMKSGYIGDALLVWDQLKAALISGGVKDDRLTVRHTVPTFEGSTSESFFETIKRVDQLKGRMLHVIVLYWGCFQTGNSHEYDEVLNSALNLDLDERERHLLLVECLPIFCNGHSRSFLSNRPRLTFEHMEHVLLKPFPGRVAHDRLSLQRILELSREKIYDNRNIFSRLDQLRVGFNIIHLLIRRGANPNTICRSVCNDLDKSNLSVKIVLIRGMAILTDHVRGFEHQVNGWRETRRNFELAASRLRCLLQEKGGRDILIPFSEHRDPGVEAPMCTYKT